MTNEQLPVAINEENVKNIVKTLDENTLSSIDDFGLEPQKRSSIISDKILATIKNKDGGEIGSQLRELMHNIDEFNPSEIQKKEENFLMKLFKKTKYSITELSGKYQSIGKQLDNLSFKVVDSSKVLKTVNENINSLRKENEEIYHSLMEYIEAGKIKIGQLDQEMNELQNENSTDEYTVNKIHSLSQYKDRLEKRTHNLKLLATHILSNDPQLKLILHNNSLLLDKVNDTISITLPVWKSQVVIAINLLQQENVNKIIATVTESTNKMIVQNSQMLKDSSINIAKSNEDSIISVETIKKEQENTIETIREVLRIHAEGSAAREEAEKQIAVLNRDLKTKLAGMENTKLIS